MCLPEITKIFEHLHLSVTYRILEGVSRLFGSSLICVRFYAWPRASCFGTETCDIHTRAQQSSRTFGRTWGLRPNCPALPCPPWCSCLLQAIKVANQAWAREYWSDGVLWGNVIARSPPEADDEAISLIIKWLEIASLRSQ